MVNYAEIPKCPVAFLLLHKGSLRICEEKMDAIGAMDGPQVGRQDGVGWDRLSFVASVERSRDVLLAS